MKYVILIFLLITFLLTNNYSQQIKTNTLEVRLNKETGQNKIKLLVQLAELNLIKNPSRTIDFSNRALKQSKIDKISRIQEAEIYNLLGAAHYYKSDFVKSAGYFENEYEIYSKTGNEKKKIESQFNIATAYSKSDKRWKAEQFYIRSLGLAKKIRSQDYLLLIYKAFSEYSRTVGKYKEALIYFNQYLLWKDAELNSDFQQKTTIIVPQFQFEKSRKDLKEELLAKNLILDSVQEKKQFLEKDTLLKSQAIKELSSQKELKDKELGDKNIALLMTSFKIKYQQALIQGITIAILIILIFLFLVFYFYRKIQTKNRQLALQNDEIEDQASLLDHKNKLLEEKNTRILDSINYASRIQDAILVSENEIHEHIPELFIYFHPKDIVSGDFYWFSKIDDKFVIAAIDCTGHGVPGAFMSMIGNTLLNEIVIEKRIIKPDLILSNLHQGIIKAMHQRNEEDSDDGMDITLCTIDTTNRKLLYAGAKNNLYVIKNNQLNILRADYHSIGGMSYSHEPDIDFPFYEMDYDHNTIVYLLTDGYLDQFGGKEDKKYNIQRFKELLLNNFNLPIAEQKVVIENTMLDWKGNRKQIDDMLVMGLRIPFQTE
jgi:serine phosphatase RsbU (regulator of sigma subunit)